MVGTTIGPVGSDAEIPPLMWRIAKYGELALQTENGHCGVLVWWLGQGTLALGASIKIGHASAPLTKIPIRAATNSARTANVTHLSARTDVELATSPTVMPFSIVSCAIR